jgi:hypothetical protein
MAIGSVYSPFADAKSAWMWRPPLSARKRASVAPTSPHRAYLLRVGRRIQYWIVYTVDEDARIVDVLLFWNASRDPQRLDLS